MEHLPKSSPQVRIPCYICTGKPVRNVCRRHAAEIAERAARFNIAEEQAAWELRQYVVSERSE